MNDSRYSREKWDQRWQEKAALPAGQPDDWLLRVLPHLPDLGEALDLACGMGRNALVLARAGYQVTAVDFSPVALDLLSGVAAQEGLPVAVECADLETGDYRVAPASYDLGLQFYYLHRPLLPLLQDAVRPGGYMVVRTFSQAGEERFGPVNREISFAPGELLNLFSNWEILLYEEGLEPSRKGGSLVGLFARKQNGSADT
ncbi:methyltransferase domain-containing protein [Pelovirga terrestris]|uniref:Methyltransferase domain-containing protein n=1 Tax=Pelovirga terrestris TaxID=2771352 RepID=A0A8J6QL75_9BACT|nr:methyltransferase domain-containing protein [Pelovirga terrestris]MBD1400354.1 methyltransferase domain-containing protein [Pelovirga terrestris]